MAKMLVASMEESWQPEAFDNDYLNKLQEIIDAKVKSGGKSSRRSTQVSAGKVVDLIEALQQSLKAGGGKKKTAAKGAKKAG